MPEEIWFAVYNLTTKELVSVATEIAPQDVLTAKNFGVAILPGPPSFDVSYWDPATIAFKPKAGIPDFITPFATKAQARMVAKNLLESNPASWTTTQTNQCLALLLAKTVFDLRTGVF